jgi:hypothetical protein
MAMQTGWIWFEDRERTDMLDDLARQGVEIEVAANPESVIQDIALGLRDPSLKLRYKSFDETLAEWHKYELEFSNLHLYVCSQPILRREMIVTFDTGEAKAFLQEYTYGSAANDTSPSAAISSSASSFAFYQKEFEYLKSKSQKYETWLASLPGKEEQMEEESYILITPHFDSDQKENDFVYSMLQIKENNAVLYFENIDFSDTLLKEQDAFPGNLKLSSANLDISIHDKHL